MENLFRAVSVKKNILIFFVITSLCNFSCSVRDVEDRVDVYPLLSLFEAAKTLDGKKIEVMGYFGYWDDDIPVLFATRQDFMVRDGLYKSHIIYGAGRDSVRHAEKSDVGRLCRFRARVWYKYSAPTLEDAMLVNCR